MDSTKNTEKRGAILIIDDDPAVLILIQTILTAAGYRVAPAGSGADAIRLVSQRHLQIDVAVIDVKMPKVQREFHRVPLTTTLTAPITTLMTKGNVALLSSTPTRSCARCGTRFYGHGREYSCRTCRNPPAPVRENGKQVQLSFREQQIVDLIRQAKTNKEIAYELSLGEGTIREYLYRIFRKLAVTNRTELALRPPRPVLPLNGPPASEAATCETTY